jgi:hypothetical protein
MSEEMLEQVFQVGEPANLDLNNIRGSVKISPQGPEMEERTIIVKAVKDLESGDGELTKIEMAQSKDGKVVVKTLFAGPELPGLQKLKHRPCKVHYSVQVPMNCRVKVETVSSSIELENLEGGFEIGSVSGDLELRSLNGDLKAQSVSGKIKGEALNGQTNCENVSGNIHLNQSRIPALKAKTVSGEMIIQAAGQTDTYNFHSISGDLTLILTESQGISVQMQSLSGKLHMHYSGGVASQRAPKDLSVQGGGPKVRFETISGDLHLTTPGLLEAETAEAEDSAPNQHTVLASVARGELTAEEGLQALKGSGPE